MRCCDADGSSSCGRRRRYMRQYWWGRRTRLLLAADDAGLHDAQDARPGELLDARELVVVVVDGFLAPARHLVIVVMLSLPNVAASLQRGRDPKCCRARRQAKLDKSKTLATHPKSVPIGSRRCPRRGSDAARATARRSL
eukprot:scaffold935_cov334-Prasinococcus_capsulatus_cf.AAC.1